MERRDRADGPVATFFAPDPLAPRRSVTLGEEEAHHARVRRVDVGERVRLVDGAGVVADGTLVRLGKDRATVEIVAVRAEEPPAAIHLLVPIADRDRMLWLAEKCAELGLASWRPVLWHRSRSVSPRGEGLAFQAKVRARMVAALKQSGGAWLPAMHPDAPVPRAIAAAPSGTRLLLDADGAPLAASPRGVPVTVALGPEGGMEASERDAFVDAGFRPVSLAPTILRFETAGVAALAVLRALLATQESPRA